MMKRALLLAGTIALAANPAIAQNKSVKIGFVSTFSGPTAAMGNDMRNSLEVALDHLDRKMNGIPVEVTYEDDQQKPDVGKQKTDKLIESGKIPADESVVLCITGNGLKTQEAILGKCGEPRQIKPSLKEFEELIAAEAAVA